MQATILISHEFLGDISGQVVGRGQGIASHAEGDAHSQHMRVTLVLPLKTNTASRTAESITQPHIWPGRYPLNLGSRSIKLEPRSLVHPRESSMRYPTLRMFVWSNSVSPVSPRKACRVNSPYGNCISDISRFSNTNVLVVLSVDDLPFHTYGTGPSSLGDRQRFFTLGISFDINHGLCQSFFHG
jgi:hypothetical protein